MIKMVLEEAKITQTVNQNSFGHLIEFKGMGRPEIADPIPITTRALFAE
jgi:hypothetical protein